MSYAQTLFSFTDTNTIYFGKARQKTKYIAWEHLKRQGVTEWYHHGKIGHPYYIISILIQTVITCYVLRIKIFYPKIQSPQYNFFGQILFI